MFKRKQKRYESNYEAAYKAQYRRAVRLQHLGIKEFLDDFEYTDDELAALDIIHSGDDIPDDLELRLLKSKQERLNRYPIDYVTSNDRLDELYLKYGGVTFQ